LPNFSGYELMMFEEKCKALGELYLR